MARKEDEGSRYSDERFGIMAASLDRMVSRHWSGEVDVTGLKLKLGNDTVVETLVILTGVWGDGTPVVAFHSAAPVSEAIAGAMRRLMNGTLKWKEDEYATGRKKGSTPDSGNGGRAEGS